MIPLNEAQKNLDEKIPRELLEDWITFKKRLKDVEANYRVLQREMAVLEVQRKLLDRIG
jgi:hypothetical protein